MIPASQEQSANTFAERLEMMVLAFIDKHHRKPKLISGQEMSPHAVWAGVFLDAKQVDDDPTVHPKLDELARHGARAWRLWTKLEPDEVVLYLAANSAGSSRVTIEPRTRTHEVRVASAAILEIDAMRKKD
jgi:hypothetical protein